MNAALKRCLDLIGASLALLVLAPVLGMAALAIRLGGDGPVLFRQRRIGRGGRPFTILKLRTLPPDGGPASRLGRLLRLTSLDELPQLWNVLRGDMSLVGPRPQLASNLPLDCPRRMRRHDCLPGITGLAQVRGRNLLSWKRRFESDLEYVARQSLLLDFVILVRTVPVVLSLVGANAAPSASNPTGSAQPAPPAARASAA